MIMSFEKAELILQTLLVRDRDFFLIRNQNGRVQITDRPRIGERLIERMPKKTQMERRLGI
jgi:hypothetical protein